MPWADIIPRAGSLDVLPAFDQYAIVRTEAPGKDDQATRKLLEARARDDSAAHRDWRALELPKGLLVRPGLLYGGFRRVLVRLRNAFDSRSHLKPTACPLAIAGMFDKTATAVKLHNAGVTVPDMMSQPIDIAAVVHDLTLVNCTARV